MTWFFVRHGQSTYNLENRFTGWHNPSLSELGEKQATETARKLSDRESVSNLSFYIFIGPTLLGAIGSYYSWIPLNPWDFFLFFLTGLTGGLAFIFFNLALQKAEASLLTSFEYTGLIWASLAGYFIFNEIVDSRVWLGAAIIIMCGIIILFRESKLAKTNENSVD